MEQHEKEALEKWQRKLRRKRIQRICYRVIPVLAFGLFVLHTWRNANQAREWFTSFMDGRFSGSLEFYKKFFNIGFLVAAVILFILLLIGVLKVKKHLTERKADDFDGRFENIGVKNKRGMTPSFLKKIEDPNVVDGEIYLFEDADVDFGKFDDPGVVRGLQNIFRGLVRPDPGNEYGVIRFYVSPLAKASHRKLSAADIWIAKHLHNAGLFGPPGSGKTVGASYLMWLKCLHADQNDIKMLFSIFDQKLTFVTALGIADSSSFFYGMAVLDGLEAAVATLDKIKLNPDGVTRLYFIDEAITFIERLEQIDRKKAARAKSLIATIAYEGREYNSFLILAGQSSHAERFSPGVRDSLNSKFYFGDMSETEKRMLFPSDVALMDAHNGTGEGYYRIENIMPHVERFSIRDAVPSLAEVGAMVRRYME